MPSVLWFVWSMKHRLALCPSLLKADTYMFFFSLNISSFEEFFDNLHCTLNGITIDDWLDAVLIYLKALLGFMKCEVVPFHRFNSVSRNWTTFLLVSLVILKFKSFIILRSFFPGGILVSFIIRYTLSPSSRYISWSLMWIISFIFLETYIPVSSTTTALSNDPWGTSK